MKLELVAKTIVFNPDGLLLVLKRDDNDRHRPSQWDLPGGQVEIGEDPRDGATREAYEETTLRLFSLRPVHVASHIHRDECQVIKTVFTTHEYSGAVTLSREHSAFNWVSVDDFIQLPISNDYKIAVQMTQKRVAYQE